MNKQLAGTCLCEDKKVLGDVASSAGSSGLPSGLQHLWCFQVRFAVPSSPSPTLAHPTHSAGRDKKPQLDNGTKEHSG